MSTGFIKPRLWNATQIMADASRHNEPVGDDPKTRRVSYWHEKGYGTVSGRRCCKCQEDLKRFPVYDGPRKLCAACMEKSDIK